RPRGVPARPIAAEDLSQLGPGAPMTVPTERSRVVHDAVAGGQDPDEELVVGAGPRPRPAPEGLVERADEVEGGAAHRHVRRGAGTPRRERVDVGAIEDLPHEATPERAVPLEPALRLGLQLEGHREAG